MRLLLTALFTWTVLASVSENQRLKKTNQALLTALQSLTSELKVGQNMYSEGGLDAGTCCSKFTAECKACQYGYDSIEAYCGVEGNEFTPGCAQYQGSITQYEVYQNIQYCSGSNLNVGNLWSHGNDDGSSHCPLCQQNGCEAKAMEYCTRNPECAGFDYSQKSTSTMASACFRSSITYFKNEPTRRDTCYFKTDKTVSKINAVKYIYGWRCKVGDEVSAIYKGNGKRYSATITELDPYIKSNYQTTASGDKFTSYDLKYGNQGTVEWADGGSSYKHMLGALMYTSDGRPCHGA